MPNHLPTPTPREYCHLSRHRSRQNTAPPRAVRPLTQRRHAHGGKRAPALGQVVPLLVTRAGFTDSDALQIYRALFEFLHGYILKELQQIVERPEENDDLLRLGLHRLPIREFSILRLARVRVSVGLPGIVSGPVDPRSACISPPAPCR